MTQRNKVGWPTQTGPMLDTARSCPDCGTSILTFFICNSNYRPGDMCCGWTHDIEASNHDRAHGTRRCLDIVKSQRDAGELYHAG